MDVSRTELFLGFAKIGLLRFGGAPSAISGLPSVGAHLTGLA
ncbi:hypothetical protein BH10PSE6_BH10PSE6_50810 [soil metagenome]